jgi:hypothetical protein
MARAFGERPADFSGKKRTAAPCDGCGYQPKGSTWTLKTRDRTTGEETVVTKTDKPRPWRYVGEVCKQCKTLLAEARAAREKALSEVAEQPVYALGEEVPYISRRHSRGFREGVETALRKLLFCVARPYPGRPANARTLKGHRSAYDGKFYTLPEGFEEVFEMLQVVIAEEFEAAWHAGMKNGRGLLQGLANGSVTLQQFENFDKSKG